MSDYRIYCDMDAMDIMACLSNSEKVNFLYECFECLELYQQHDFIESLGVEEVVNHLDNGEIVEYIGDEDLIEELKMRGYKITKDGSEDN